MSTPGRRYIPSTKLPDKADTVSLDSAKDLTSMLSRTLAILDREVSNINSESVRGKLSKESSAALVQYIKLLGELQTKEKDLLEELNEAELESHRARNQAQTESK